MSKNLDKEEIRQKIRNDLCINFTIPSFNSYESMDQQFNNIKYSIEQAIEHAIADGIGILVDELYTQDDFENDIGLK